MGGFRTSHPPAELEQIAEWAAEVGLVLRACVPAGPVAPEVIPRLESWLQMGKAGDMDWLKRTAPLLPNLQAWKPWAQSIMVFTLPYARSAGGFLDGGRVARYALGKDYHHVFGRRLEKLGKRLRRQGLVQQFRGASDAAPVMEREWALASGLGFRGKNTLLLDLRQGPWQLIGELLVDREWPAWTIPSAQPSCGGCTACLDACPTDAFEKAWDLDPRQCISYWTIEAAGSIPRSLRSKFGDWVFGCDVCLEVCPFGSRAQDQSSEWGTLPALAEWSLEDLLRADEERFENAFRGSPIRRPGLERMQRNACIALGNQARGGGGLRHALQSPSNLVREHAAWALGQLGDTNFLKTHAIKEKSSIVKAEIDYALDSAN
ncbi:MAG: tRNA epoxyqueuosine(34) reductase QueG [Planctomycetes bacterium]|nr:tRNA epoxyqueuosine(34) reductase QueG [Planctomycetota bacterium]